MDGGDGLVVVLGSPGVGPVAAADGPCAKADGGEVKVGVAEGAKGVRTSSSHFTSLDAAAAWTEAEFIRLSQESGWNVRAALEWHHDFNLML